MARPDHIKLAAIAPGRVLIAGYMGRVWLASASFDGDKRRVEVFHEARQADNREDDTLQATTTVAFQPGELIALSDALAGKNVATKKVVIVRNSANHGVRNYPLIVDADTQRVSVADFVFPPTPNEPFHFASAGHKLFHPQFRYDEKCIKLGCLTSPVMSEESLYDDPPDGMYHLQGDLLHILGRKWWIFDTRSRELRVAADPVPWLCGDRWTPPGKPHIPWVLPGPEDYLLQAVHTSQHFGTLVWITRQADRQVLNATLCADTGNTNSE